MLGIFLAPLPGTMSLGLLTSPGGIFLDVVWSSADAVTSGAVVSGVVLSGEVLSGAVLSGAVFSGAVVSGGVPPCEIEHSSTVTV